MRGILSLAAAATILAVSGCDRAIVEPYGPLTGTWRYQATGFRQWGSEAACSLEVVIQIRQEGNSIEGRQTEEAPVFCTYPDGRVESYGGVLDGPIQTQRSGSFVLERISDEGYYGPAA
jgi:hypothetical protein